MEIYNLKSTFSKIDNFESFKKRESVTPISLIVIENNVYVEYINSIDELSYIKEQEEMRKQIAPKPQAQVV